MPSPATSVGSALVNLAPTTGVIGGSVGASLPTRPVVDFLASLIVLPRNCNYNAGCWVLCTACVTGTTLRNTQGVRLPANRFLNWAPPCRATLNSNETRDIQHVRGGTLTISRDTTWQHTQTQDRSNGAGKKCQSVCAVGREKGRRGLCLLRVLAPVILIVSVIFFASHRSEAHAFGRQFLRPPHRCTNMTTAEGTSDPSTGAHGSLTQNRGIV